MSGLFVKICGLRTRDAVDAAIDAGASAIGLVFADSPRRVTIDEARALLAHAGSRITSVGVFRHPSAHEAHRVIDDLPIDVVQSDAEDFEVALAFVPCAQRLPVVRVGEGVATRLRRAIDESGRALVEGAHSGAGQRVAIDDIASLPDEIRSRVIIAGGLDRTNVLEVIDRVRPLGVDVSSGVERALGEKDLSLIQRFVRAARDAERIST